MVRTRPPLTLHVCRMPFFGYIEQNGPARGRPTNQGKRLVPMHRASSTQPSHGGEDGFWMRMEGGSQAAARARRQIARLQERLGTPLLDDMRLLVTELVSNSVRHAGAHTVEVTVAVRPRDVRVEVANRGAPFTPTTRESRLQNDPGWGLFLLDRLSDDWGVLEEAGYQRVWFEMARN